MINVKLDMKRLIKLLEKEFPDNYVAVEYQIRTMPSIYKNTETFKAYIADHSIFRGPYGNYSTWTREFTNVKELTAYVKEVIHDYRIAQSKLIEQENDLPPEDSLSTLNDLTI